MSLTQKLALCLALILASSFIGGCSPTEDDFDPDTVATIGAIDAFGSIVVAGILWDDLASANFTINGQPGAEIDLHLGMTVQVEGKIANNGSTLGAHDVIYDPSLIGPVASESGSGDSKTLTIHGASVEIDRFTAYHGTTFDTLSVGRIYEVSGHVDDAGVLIASFVRDLGVEELGVSPVIIRGIVTDLDVAGAGLFLIGNVTIDYSQALIEGIEVLEDGAVVAIRGNLGAISDEVIATEVGPAIVYPGDAAYFYLDGTLTLDGSQWGIAGFPVDFIASTFYDPVDGVYGEGTRVWICGYYRNGKATVGWLRLEEPNTFVHAAVATASDVNPLGDLNFPPWVDLLPVDVPGDRLTVGNLVDFDTMMIDSRDGLDPFTIDDIAAGDHLRISAVGLGPASLYPDLTRILRLERVLSVGSVFLTGKVNDDVFYYGIGDDWFRLQGTQIFTDGFTNFSDSGGSITALEFYTYLTGGLLEGKTVSVTDLTDGDETTIDFADTVQIID